MCTGNREDSQSISKYVHGQVSQYTQFLNVTEIGPDAYGIKSGRVPIYKAARVCSAPTHMGVCVDFYSSPLGVVSQFLLITEKLEQKSVSQSPFLDF